MARQALPIYLTPEQHRALRERSRTTGRSMSDLARDALQLYLFGDAVPTDLSTLAGAVDLGHPTDVSLHRDELLEDALGAVR